MFRLLLATTLIATMFAPTAYAQRDATAKALGKTNSFHTGAARQRQAYDHARVLNQLGRTAPKVSREVVQGHVEAVRAGSQASMKEFDKLKAQHPDDKAIAAHVEKLRKHHEKVLAMCTMLDEECKKAEAEGTTICECCLTMAKDLDAATKEAEKLRETLKVEPLEDPLKEKK